VATSLSYSKTSHRQGLLNYRSTLKSPDRVECRSEHVPRPMTFAGNLCGRQSLRDTAVRARVRPWIRVHMKAWPLRAHQQMEQ